MDSPDQAALAERKARTRLAALASHHTSPDRLDEARDAFRQARDNKIIAEMLDGRILSPEGLSRLAVLLAPESRETVK